MALIAQSDTTAIEHDITELDTINVANEIDVNFNPALNADGYQNLYRFYAKLHELEQSQSGKVRIAYFGDSMNDYEILRLVGNSRAMGNARYGIKQIAKQTIGTNVEHSVQKEMRAMLRSFKNQQAS